MGVRVGDPISFDVAFARLGDTIVVGKALDDRVGCAALAAAVERLDDIDGTLYAVGTIQEEVGLRGATTAAFGLAPDVGLALDATVAGGVPGMTEVETAIKLGRGPAITVADRGLITHPTILRHLIDAAERNGIPYQLETGLPGSTDAARIALTREGVPSGVISIPTRYIHSPVSLLSLEDAENAVKLACAAVASLARGG